MKKNCILLTCILLLIASVLYSCSRMPGEDDPGNRLKLSATAIAGHDGFSVIVKELVGDTDADICCLGCENVTVEIDGKSVPLEEAVGDGRLSFNKIRLLAQEDAEKGFCTLTWECENGLTKFCFHYPQLDLWLTDDIYKTPDGKEHHIRDITVCKPGKEFAVVFNDAETGDRIDLEDWGIHFTVVQASPTGITLRYFQSSSQVIGQLFATHFEIYKRDPWSELTGGAGSSMSMENQPIVPDAESQMSLSWDGSYGALDSGEYTMYLYLTDVYEKEKISPLTNNFYDTQVYTIVFSLP